jgi:uncharacterized protein YndB with AHSA1/START domain
MKEETLEIKTSIQISKPVQEVFEAVIDPAKMTNYFISYGSGRMIEGTEVTWKFPEFPDEFPIRVSKVEMDKSISYSWKSDDVDTLVEITFSSPKIDESLVTVTEKSRENDEAGISWLKGNTAGWANFLDCLKAWLEYGINLRKGAFDYMRNETA